MNLYQSLLKNASTGKKKFAVLVDPDKYSLESLARVVKLSVNSGVDYYFLGGEFTVA